MKSVVRAGAWAFDIREITKPWLQLLSLAQEPANAVLEWLHVLGPRVTPFRALGQFLRQLRCTVVPDGTSLHLWLQQLGVLEKETPWLMTRTALDPALMGLLCLMFLLILIRSARTATKVQTHESDGKETRTLLRKISERLSNLEEIQPRSSSQSMASETRNSPAYNSRSPVVALQEAAASGHVRSSSMSSATTDDLRALYNGEQPHPAVKELIEKIERRSNRRCVEPWDLKGAACSPTNTTPQPVFAPSTPKSSMDAQHARSGSEINSEILAVRRPHSPRVAQGREQQREPSESLRSVVKNPSSPVGMDTSSTHASISSTLRTAPWPLQCDEEFSAASIQLHGKVTEETRAYAETIPGMMETKVAASSVRDKQAIGSAVVASSTASNMANPAKVAAVKRMGEAINTDMVMDVADALHSNPSGGMNRQHTAKLPGTSQTLEPVVREFEYVPSQLSLRQNAAKSSATAEMDSVMCCSSPIPQQQTDVTKLLQQIEATKSELKADLRQNEGPQEPVDTIKTIYALDVKVDRLRKEIRKSDNALKRTREALDIVLRKLSHHRRKLEVFGEKKAAGKYNFGHRILEAGDRMGHALMLGEVEKLRGEHFKHKRAQDLQLAEMVVLRQEKRKLATLESFWTKRKWNEGALEALRAEGRVMARFGQGCGQLSGARIDHSYEVLNNVLAGRG